MTRIKAKMRVLLLAALAALVGMLAPFGEETASAEWCSPEYSDCGGTGVPGNAGGGGGGGGGSGSANNPCSAGDCRSASGACVSPGVCRSCNNDGIGQACVNGAWSYCGSCW